jgi:hypothetical protein
MVHQAFTDEEWKLIFEEVEKNPKSYGLPQRTDKTTLIGSFNIRKLGLVSKRTSNTWKFLGLITNQFDLLAVQESLDDMQGMYRLKDEANKIDGTDDWKMISSDMTGTYPGDFGLGERLMFLYRSSVVELGEVVSDVTYDRTKVTQLLFENLDTINAAKAQFDTQLADYEAGTRKSKPRMNPTTFLSFIRSPYCVSFNIKGPNPELHEPYSFMGINAHLMYGTTKDRWMEFQALISWIRHRVEQAGKSYYPNFILLGDLNLDYDNPTKDFAKLETYVKNIDESTPNEVKVNFPFLDVHPNQKEQFTSNVKLTQRYDQIGLFFRDDDGSNKGYPTHTELATMGKDGDNGPDYGVFNFTELFSMALLKKTYGDLTTDEQKSLVKRYEFEVSDHMPLWLRLKFVEKKPTTNKRKAEEELLN